MRGEDAPVEGVEGSSSREEAVVEELLGQGSTSRIAGTGHDVDRHAARQLRHRHVQLPAHHQRVPFTLDQRHMCLLKYTAPLDLQGILP